MTGPEQEQDAEGPIVVPHNGSPACASGPDVLLQTDRYLRYEHHPVPWWVALAWVGFFVFAIAYLVGAFSP